MMKKEISENESVPRGLQDCEARAEAEKDGGITLCSERAGHLAGRFSHRKGQQAVPGHKGMGLRRVRLSACVRYVQGGSDRHRQLRFRVPYDREGQGLHFSLVPETVRKNHE